MRRQFRVLTLTTLLSSSALAAPAGSEPRNDHARAIARSLGEEGLDAWERGELAVALDRFERAYKLHPVPTLALWTGRVLEKMGRLVAASERWREASHLDVSGGDERAQQQAQEQAEAARAAIQRRIPRLTIMLRETVPTDGKLQLDGTELPKAAIGIPIPIDPGEHEIVLRLRAGDAQRRIRLAPGEQAVVQLPGENEAQPASGSEVSRANGVASSLGRTRDTDSSAVPRGQHDSSLQRGLGWVALGLGAAGLATWGATGILVLTRSHELKQECPNDLCDPGSQSELDEFRRFRTISTVGFAVGLVGATAGTLLLVTAPSKTKQLGHDVSWRAWASINGVGFAGEY